MKKDYGLIGRSLEDVIIEPLRSVLIPGFPEIKKLSKEAGALGGGISGSGPSLFMLSKTQAIAEAVAEQFSNVYRAIHLPHHTYVTTINPTGIRIDS